MAKCQGVDMEEQEAPDFTFNPVMIQGRPKQRGLWQCGFHNPYAAQLDQAKDEAMQAVHPAWSVVLEHTPLDPHLACTLLSVSCGMRHTVHLLCAGKLSVDLCDAGADSKRKLRSFARWLPRHAALLDHLDTEEVIGVQSTAAAPSLEALIARAMWEAGSKLQLDSCAFYSGMLVQQAALLPSLRTRLTSLTFAPKGGLSVSEAQPVIAALRQLTALQSLTCHENYPRSINNLLPGVSGLTNLTELSAGFNRHAELGKYLPASLVKLYIGSCPLVVDAASKDVDSDDPDAKRYLPPCAVGTGQPFTLNLSHLTAVTLLDFLWEDDSADWTALYLGDELPPNTRQLYAGVEHGAALAVLCPLQKLTYMDLHCSGVTAAHLRALTCLTNLTELNFCEHSFDDDPDDTLVEIPADYCAAWPLLPIYDVTVRGIVTPHVLESLAETTNLTTLLLHYDKGSSANLFQLAAALKPLKQLQELDLAWEDDHPGVRWWPDEGKVSCVSALSEMPDLSKLWLKGLPLPRAAAEPMAQLQQLTTLQLACCDVDNYCVNVIALKLTGLVNLHLEDNKKVTDVSMPAVGSLMQKLTYLDLRHTRITQMGLEWLQQLPLLSRVYTCKCNVTDPKVQQWAAWWDACYRWECRHPTGAS